MTEPTPQQLARAHQYLYCVVSRPVISDYDYDMLCRRHGIDGGGGSDCVEHYTEADKALAVTLTNPPKVCRCQTSEQPN